MAICKGLVDGMGGTIGVQSEVGQGSTFWFTVHLTGTPIATSPRSDIAELSGLRVLAVDDNSTNRTILREQLTAGGLLVTTASDGPMTLEHLQEAVSNQQSFAAPILDSTCRAWMGSRWRAPSRPIR